MTPEGPPAKRGRTDSSRPDTGNILTDPSTISSSKGKGILVFDPLAAGTSRLPLCPVRDKAPGSRAQERCCMPFMTQGHYCPKVRCPNPHFSSLRHFSSDKKRDEFVKFVSKTPGLAWSPGNAPPGEKPSSTA